MPIRKTDVHPRAPRAPLDLGTLVAREHARVVKLEREAKALARRLSRARLRYSVLMRLSADEARRFAGEAPTRLSKSDRRALTRTAEEEY